MTEHGYCFDTYTRTLTPLDSYDLELIGDFQLTNITEPNDEQLCDLITQGQYVVELLGMYYLLS